ncbi:MAG: hypothetical protein ACKOXB_00005 [Flavobacteriales bacterium]
MRTIRLFLVILFSVGYVAQALGQEYVAKYYLGIQRNFGSLTNPYTNAQKESFTEGMGITLLEFGAEGMDKNFFVSAKSHFFGVIPDYIVRAVNKNNVGTIYGESLENFHAEYNTVKKQYDYNASFSDWDVLGGNIAYGYKYAFAGVNFAWAATTLKAYESVSNIKIKDQKPANFFSFNTEGNFTYGLNLVFSNNKPENPIRLICAYDWLLMRDYNRKWQADMGTRLSFDLQGNLPWKFHDDKWQLYIGAAYRSHNINYTYKDNGVEGIQQFKSSIASLRLGLLW